MVCCAPCCLRQTTHPPTFQLVKHQVNINLARRRFAEVEVPSIPYALTLQVHFREAVVAVAASDNSCLSPFHIFRVRAFSIRKFRQLVPRLLQRSQELKRFVLALIHVLSAAAASFFTKRRPEAFTSQTPPSATFEAPTRCAPPGRGRSNPARCCPATEAAFTTL